MHGTTIYCVVCLVKTASARDIWNPKGLTRLLLQITASVMKVFLFSYVSKLSKKLPVFRKEFSMKKCKKCGALQSDEKTICLDCGTLLGRSMTAEEEKEAETVLDEKLTHMSERMEDFYVPLRNKVMGILCIVGVIAACVLLGLCIHAKDAIQADIPINVSIAHNGLSAIHFVTGEGYTYDYIYPSQRIDTLNRASGYGILGIVSLLFAFFYLLFPRLMWNIGTIKYRIFRNWDTTPSDTALVGFKVMSYILFGVGIGVVLWGWVLYL